MFHVIRPTEFRLALGGISKSTFRRLLADPEAGLPKPIQISPRIIGWRSDEVEAFLESRERAAMVEPPELAAARAKAAGPEQPRRRGRPPKNAGGFGN